MPRAFPDNLRTELERVVTFINRSVPPPTIDSSDPQLEYFTKRSPLESRSTITVDGERGTGKTTLLNAAMEQLSPDASLIVLPILRPELFVTSDSLFGRLIESLADYVHSLHKDVYDAPFGTDGRTFGAELDRLARLEAASRRETSPISAERTEDLADDALTTTRRSSEFEALWRPFVDAALDAVNATRLVVPIDDADLAPEHLPWLLTDIRRLDDHPAITCVVALNSDDLRDFLRGAVLRQSSLAEEQFPRLGVVISRQIEKALPQQNWVRLRPWTTEQRLQFRLIGDRSASVEDLIHRIADGLPASRMRTPDGLPSQLAKALPSRPRPLERLVIELDSAIGDDATDVLVAAIRDHLDDALHQFAHPVPRPLEFSRTADGLTMRLNLSSWGFFSDIGSDGAPSFDFKVEHDEADYDVSLSLPRYHGTLARMGRVSDETAPRLPDEAVASVLLMLDLDANGLFSSSSVVGGRPVPGGDNWRRPHVIFDGESTDQLFLTAPSWPGFHEYSTLSFHLNAAIDSLVGVDVSDPRGAIEWFTLTHLFHVARIGRAMIGMRHSDQLLRGALDLDMGQRVARGSKWWHAEREVVAKSVYRYVGSTYLGALKAPHADRQIVALIEWYESAVLGACHPAILGADLSEMLADTWSSTVSKTARERSAKARASQWLRDRLAAAGSDTWGDPIASLGERLRLGPEFESHQRTVDTERVARREEAAGKVGRNAAARASRTRDRATPRTLSRTEAAEVQKVARAARSTANSRTRPVDGDRQALAIAEAVLREIGQGRLLAQRLRPRTQSRR